MRAGDAGVTWKFLCCEAKLAPGLGARAMLNEPNSWCRSTESILPSNSAEEMDDA